MSVKLISITSSCIPEAKTAEELITYCARVSNPSNQANMDTSAKLLKYCIKNGHWSIFEQASLTVEVKTSRAIARQILRHRSFSFQEFSQRYAQVSDDFILNKARAQDSKNRQASHDTLPDSVKESFEAHQRMVWGNAMGAYKYMLDQGVAKETARALLPEGLAPSTMYMTGTVRSFIHYLEVRTHESTQLEHREIAEQIKQIFIEQFPVIAKALEWK